MLLELLRSMKQHRWYVGPRRQNLASTVYSVKLSTAYCFRNSNRAQKIRMPVFGGSWGGWMRRMQTPRILVGRVYGSLSYSEMRGIIIIDLIILFPSWKVPRTFNIFPNSRCSEQFDSYSHWIQCSEGRTHALYCGNLCISLLPSS